MCQRGCPSGVCTAMRAMTAPTARPTSVVIRASQAMIRHACWRVPPMRRTRVSSTWRPAVVIGAVLSRAAAAKAAVRPMSRPIGHALACAAAANATVTPPSAVTARAPEP